MPPTFSKAVLTKLTLRAGRSPIMYSGLVGFALKQVMNVRITCLEKFFEARIQYFPSIASIVC